MKRLLAWIPAALLLLSGCSGPPAQETSGQTETTANALPQPTETDPGLYEPGSDLEVRTDGAVRAYPLSGGMVTGISMMGADVAVFFSDGENTTVVRLSGENCTAAAETVWSGYVDPWGSSYRLSDDKAVYYSGSENCCIIQDGQFRETDRMEMPEDIFGSPLLSEDMTTAYYCTGSEIRAMDLQTGISRLLCQMSSQEIYLNALQFDGTMLQCYVLEPDGDGYEEFISTETGVSLGSDRWLMSFDSWEDRFLVRRMDGTVTEVLVGTLDGQLRSLVTDANSADVHVLPGLNSVTEQVITDNGVTVDLYELTNGNKTASVTLTGVSGTYSIRADQSGDHLWFLTVDSATGGNILCRWDMAASALVDRTVRLGDRYTAENPDTEGLALCQTLAETLEQTYGVEITLGTEVLNPDDYTFTYEYQVQAYEKSLAALEKAMSRFPDGFFGKAASVSNNGKLHIGLVRSMESTTYDAPADTFGLQYWLDGSAYMALATGDTVEQNFYHELSHALDTYVYSNSVHYDFWEDCNPGEFEYDECYTEYENHYDSPYLTGEDRVFIDAYSMTYAHEDRARVFEYAMLEGSEALFASETMQAKLKLLCQGIRQAFGWKKYEGTFIWEQYLNESLAYVKEK